MNFVRKNKGKVLTLALATAWAAPSNLHAEAGPTNNTAARLFVTLVASGSCAEKSAVAWLSKGRTLVYQADVSANGSFEFYTVPGKYDLVVTTESGCMVERKITAQAGQTQSLGIELEGSGRTPASMRSTYCPSCNVAPVVGVPTFFPPAYPWWGNYGALAYHNFAYPGVWGGDGIRSSAYPPGGHGFMGKPNVYVSGKAGSEFYVQVKLPASSKWLISAPAHGEKGWHGKVEADGKIRVSEKESRDFFFYDFRFDESGLQDSAGFCGDREDVFSRSAALLQKRGFKPNEVTDFQTHWSVKLPHSESYCVYPQENRELDRVAALQIHPKPKKLTRIAFVIVPKELKRPLASGVKFSRRPQSEWAANEPSSNERAPSNAQSDLEVREWGVGFLQGQ